MFFRVQLVVWLSRSLERQATFLPSLPPFQTFPHFRVLEQECLEQSDALLRLLCRELGVPLSRVRVNLEHDNPVTRNRGGREGAPTTVSSMGKES